MRPDKQRWPERLWVVRHGESAGNVARDAADRAGLERIDIALRDADVDLSELGVHQAQALGRWFGSLPPDERPTVVFTSPYVRAEHTAREVLRAMGAPPELPLRIDERLREKELGSLDRLTRRGIIAHFPEQSELRTRLGKFYYRPPGGESWCDVILRLRSALETLCREHRGERVLIVSHQVVVLCLRYVLENMTEAQLLEIDRAADVANCSVTAYRYDPSAEHHLRMRLEHYNRVEPLKRVGEPVTSKKDIPGGAL